MLLRDSTRKRQTLLVKKTEHIHGDTKEENVKRCSDKKEMRRVRVCLCADSRDAELENFKSQVKSSSLIFLLFGSKKKRNFDEGTDLKKY